MKTVIRMLSSGFYIGYSPVAPGTLGSLWGALIYLQLYRFHGAYFFAVLLLFLLGFLLSSRAEEIFKEKDPKKVVIDETASMALVYLFIRPTWFMLVAGFILFRLFDIIKPPPARRLELLPGGLGIMLDDIVAAVYTVAALFLIYTIRRKGIL